MQIPIIKKTVELYSISELKEAEEAMLEELYPKIIIEGYDEGEKLTHVLAAIWIKEEMVKENLEFPAALREYTKKVRTSIS